jgi:hypothetical protein
VDWKSTATLKHRCAAPRRPERAQATEATPALAGRAWPLEAGFPGRCPGLICPHAVGVQNVQTPDRGSQRRCDRRLPSGNPPGCEKRPRPAWYRSGHKLGSNHLGPPKIRVRSRVRRVTACAPTGFGPQRRARSAAPCQLWLDPPATSDRLQNPETAAGSADGTDKGNPCSSVVNPFLGYAYG